MNNFLAYQLACRLYHACIDLRVPSHLRNQLDRASSSVALNLAEGWGRKTFADQRNFFTIAYGSAKETQAILQLVGHTSGPTFDLADHVAACAYRLAYKKKA